MAEAILHAATALDEMKTLAHEYGNADRRSRVDHIRNLQNDVLSAMIGLEGVLFPEKKK